jgi:ketosteroid isomerase-like protein
MKKIVALATATALAVTAGQASAQSSQRTPQDIFGSIFGALFGDRAGVTTSIEAEWAAGRTPLANQRAQFESRVDAEVNTGSLTWTTGNRLKSDYAALVELETRYGADRRFTSAERSTLASRYGTLTQVLADRGYSDGATATAEIAANRAEFDARVNAAVAARRLTRTQGTRLKNDYNAVIRVEEGYLADGLISAAERADLDVRLDALDTRVGDTVFAALTPRDRLNAIGQALPTVRLNRAQRAQLQVEYEDISRLEAAYARLSASADERAYLERRLAELETRAGVRAAASGF